MRFLSKSIQNKLILLLLISTVIPSVISTVVIYFYTTESLKDRVLDENLQLLYQGGTNITNYMENVRQMTLALYNNTFLYNIVEKGLSDYASEMTLYAGLSNLSKMVDETLQVYYFNSINEHSYLYVNSSFIRATTGMNLEDDIIEQEVQKRENYTVEPTHIIDNYNIRQAYTNYSNKYVISAHRQLIHYPSGESMGNLSVDVGISQIYSLCRQLFAAGNEDLYLYDHNGKIIFSSDSSSLSGQTLSSLWKAEIDNAAGPSGTFEFSNNAFKGIVIYQSITLDGSEWTLAKLIPFSELFSDARQLVFIQSLIALACLVVIVIATLWISVHFTNPIRRLAHHINRVRAGHFNEELNIEREDEIGVLADNFANMMQTINEFINREYKLKLINKTAELKVLQSQINPHFLNNVLQTIGSLALKAGVPKVYELLASLAQMMHYNMGTSETVVTLGKEMEYVEDYLNLQSNRFKDKLQFEFHIADSTARLNVPKMIIQPVVENYFKHGFTRPGQGFISISSCIENRFLMISVEDNGIGIPEEQRIRLQEKLDEEQQPDSHGSSSIGLINVVSRLRIYFGSESTLSLIPREPHGLYVLLKISLHQNPGGLDIESDHSR
ncbi:sensor histidine kinase [Paenibacillus sp. S150]|uniref:sensor histidine kinase n=1 Tax=Paenibacillus sp. S150 TaxID=2749826 RepID=UPI001C5A0A27|nr:histidine kinase [Paenibacillus sp. S150]MBW4079818.1 histidine kinase [Paenibacillus sp. S150]